VNVVATIDGKRTSLLLLIFYTTIGILIIVKKNIFKAYGQNNIP